MDLFGWVVVVWVGLSAAFAFGAWWASGSYDRGYQDGARAQRALNKVDAQLRYDQRQWPRESLAEALRRRERDEAAIRVFVGDGPCYQRYHEAGRPCPTPGCDEARAAAVDRRAIGG
jgi:hypothetical protein